MKEKEVVDILNGYRLLMKKITKMACAMEGEKGLVVANIEFNSELRMIEVLFAPDDESIRAPVRFPVSYLWDKDWKSKHLKRTMDRGFGGTAVRRIIEDRNSKEKHERYAQYLEFKKEFEGEDV